MLILRIKKKKLRLINYHTVYRRFLSKRGTLFTVE